MALKTCCMVRHAIPGIWITAPADRVAVPPPVLGPESCRWLMARMAAVQSAFWPHIVGYSACRRHEGGYCLANLARRHGRVFLRAVSAGLRAIPQCISMRWKTRIPD